MTPKIGVIYAHKRYPLTRIRVTEIKPNGAVWGVYVGPIGGLFATDAATFDEMYQLESEQSK